MTDYPLAASCVHTARTNAQPPSRWTGFIASRSTRADVQFRTIPRMRPRSWQALSHAANAVWVYAHPGFKSPSLRHVDQGLCAYGAEPLIHINDHCRLRMAQ